MESFAENLKAMMASRRLSGSELGRLMGLSRQAIATILSNRSAPTLTTIQNIAKALGVPAFYLLMTPQERDIWDKKTAPHGNVWDAIAELRAKVDGMNEPQFATPEEGEAYHLEKAAEVERRIQALKASKKKIS